MTPLMDSTVPVSIPDASTSWKRSRVAQWVRDWMFSGPPTAATISDAVLMSASQNSSTGTRARTSAGVAQLTAFSASARQVDRS